MLYYAFDGAGPDVPQGYAMVCTPEKTASPDEWWKSLWQLPAYNENGEIKLPKPAPTKLPFRLL